MKDISFYGDLWRRIQEQTGLRDADELAMEFLRMEQKKMTRLAEANACISQVVRLHQPVLVRFPALLPHHTPLPCAPSPLCSLMALTPPHSAGFLDRCGLSLMCGIFGVLRLLRLPCCIVRPCSVLRLVQIKVIKSKEKVLEEERLAFLKDNEDRLQKAKEFIDGLKRNVERAEVSRTALQAT